MISNVKNGWCLFTLSDDKNQLYYTGNPSYLTNIPVDLLQAFLDYKTKGQGMAWFNEEGSEFTLVLNPYSMFIIVEDEEGEAELFDFSEINIDDLIKELIQDIESDLIGWSRFYCGCDDEEEIKVNREHIRNLICQLRRKL